MHAGCHHHAAGAPQCGSGALERHVELIAQGVTAVARQYGGVLGHGDRFASECGLIHLELGHLDQAQIRRYPVASLQQNNISRHHGAGGQHPGLPSAQHRGLRSGELFKCRQGAVGAPALYKTDGRIEHHNHQNGQCVDQVTNQP